VLAGPPDQTTPAAARRGRLRASRAEREQAIEVLKASFVQDRLTKDEFDARIGQAFASRTYAELAALTADLPVALVAAQPRPRLGRSRIRLPMNTAVTAGAAVAVAANLGMLAVLLTGSGVGVVLLAVFTVVGVMAAIGAMIVAS
jgi:Domain of unknown function (DUF1707)